MKRRLHYLTHMRPVFVRKGLEVTVHCEQQDRCQSLLLSMADGPVAPRTLIDSIVFLNNSW